MHIVAEAPAEHAFPVELCLKVEVEGVHDRCAEPSEVGDGLLEDPDHRRVSGLVVHELAEHREARPLQAVRVQAGRVVGFLAAAPGFGVVIGRVVSSDHVEHPRCVLHAAGHGSGDVPIEIEGDHAVAARETDGGTHPHQRQVRRGPADGVPRVAS